MSSTSDIITSGPLVVFAGGGTGGHLFPGLTAAEALRTRGDVDVCFFGTGRPIEQREVPRAGFPYEQLPAAPIRKTPLGLLRLLVTNYRSYRRARAVIRQRGVRLVVGLGGYGAAPMARAAGKTGVPLVLLEQNTVPGRANRYLARWAAAVCLTYEESRSYFPEHVRMELTGNPVRREILDVGDEKPDLSAWKLDPDKRTLLVWGGSQGARNINLAMAALAGRLAALRDTWQVLHQAGEADAPTVRRAYAEAGLAAHVQSFFHDMTAVYRAADLAVARAGATSLAEFACVGLPAVLVPYPHAADDHQTLNARHVVDAGAAVLVPDQSDAAANAPALWAALAPLLEDGATRDKMAAAMRALARPDAAERVADVIMELLGQGEREV